MRGRARWSEALAYSGVTGFMSGQTRSFEESDGSGVRRRVEGGGTHGPGVIDAELEQAIREADPEAFLVEPRVLRRVIRKDRDVNLLDWHGTHRQSYAIRGLRAAEFVEREELGISPEATWPEMLLLLSRPDVEEVEETEPGQLRRRDPQLLFGGSGSRHDARGGMTRGSTRRDCVSGSMSLDKGLFDEIRSVLVQEHLIQDTRDLKTSYAEFAAIYLKRGIFFPNSVETYFPSLARPERVDAILARDVNGEALHQATKLAGAAGRTAESTGESLPAIRPDDAESEPDPAGERGRHRGLLKKAIGASQRGNQVRAAITLYRAVAMYRPPGQRAIRASARREIAPLRAARPRSGSQKGKKPSGLEPSCRSWSVPASATGHPKPGCFTTCKKSRSTRNERFTN